MTPAFYIFLVFILMNAFKPVGSAQHVLLENYSSSYTILKGEQNWCAITLPAQGYVYYDPDIILIQAQVMDSTNVLKVDFYLDSLHLGTDYSLPFRNMSLFNSPMGSYKLRAVATDYSGVMTTSPPVNIFIRCVQEDLDNNGVVNISDFLLLLGEFGLSCIPCYEDLNHDGIVSTPDYLKFLRNLGVSCN